MSALWVMPDRYYYCGFCHTYYGGRVGELNLVPSPYSTEVTGIQDPSEDNYEETNEANADSKGRGGEVPDGAESGSVSGGGENNI